ncbi:hypothetical protein L3X38_040059 [Prunus dulcis]|uniref:Uncharacterized protein n=1 Tax=Prunus dulcis TaxID=3755 RepID=A0AAD4V9K1_PRUDU|nr:hypothetical protein L3X38_040059 [Prunus dulcis]
MWISVREDQSRDVAHMSRPRPMDCSGVPTFKAPNIKAGQWYRNRGPKLIPVPLSKTQIRRPQRQYATTCKAELECADKRMGKYQVMVDAKVNVVQKEAEHTAEEGTKEPLENLESSAAKDEELYGDDDEYVDDEYLEDLTEKAMKHLEK